MILTRCSYQDANRSIIPTRLMGTIVTDYPMKHPSFHWCHFKQCSLTSYEFTLL